MPRPIHPTLRILTVAGALALATCVLTLTAMERPADAAFPGENGRFLYCEESYRDNSCELFSSNPDGSGRTQLTHLDMYGVGGGP